MYLLAMLLFAVLILSLAVLSRHDSPFADTDLRAVRILEQKVRFEETQKSFQKQSDSTFAKIEKYDPEKSSPLQENDIEIGVSNIRNAFKLTDFTDTRTKSYPQISDFYKMYYDDKKSAATIKANTKLFTKQFEDCSVGYRSDRQELLQRENAQIMGNSR